VHSQAIAFGLTLTADFPLPGLRSGVPLPGRDGYGRPLRLVRVPWSELAALARPRDHVGYRRMFDGCQFAMCRRPAGDVLFDYGPRALFHLSADHRVLRCAAVDGDDPTWQRVLLDTVLWATSFLRGLELLHASAVETTAGVLALLAPSGGGKSSLAAELLRRGGRLFSDDIVAFEQVGGKVLAHPGPPLMNLSSTLAVGDPGRFETIAEIAGERWVRVRQERARPLALAAIVLVERGDVTGVGRLGARALNADCALTAATTLTLLRHGVGLAHCRKRAHRRFALFSALAAATPVYRLTADTTVPVAELADLMERRVGLGSGSCSPQPACA